MIIALGAIAIAIAIAGGCVFGFRSTGTEAAPLKASSEWKAAAPGIVEPSTGFLRLGTIESGRIADIRIHPGDKVHKGDLLVRLVDEVEQARVQSAEAELVFRTAEQDGAIDRPADDEILGLGNAVAAAEWQLAHCQSDFDAVAPSDGVAYQMARAALETARAAYLESKGALKKALMAAAPRTPNRRDAAVGAARADLRGARAALEKMMIRSPVDGVVLDVIGQPGEIVSPSPLEPIVVLGGNGPMTIRAELDQLDTGKISIGDEVTVQSDLQETPETHGRVIRVSPMITSHTLGAAGDGHVLPSKIQMIRIELDETARLPPGLRVDVFFLAKK